MLSQDAYVTSINFLTEAFNWTLSETSKSLIYERIAENWEDSALLDHALSFCDRGRGTPAQFLESLKIERRLATTHQPYKSLQQAPADAKALPPDAQLRIWKMLALMANGHQVDWSAIVINEQDRKTITTAVAEQVSCISALQKIYKKIGQPRNLAASLVHSF